MKFKAFSEYLSKIENTSGRTDITIIISELLGHLKGNEIKYAMYLLQGRLVPKFIPVEFNFSQKLILRALSQLVKDESYISTLYKKMGDAGSVAEEILSSATEPALKFEDKSLSITEVYEALKLIATATGKGSQEGKIGFYLNLFASVDPVSAKYLTRMIVGTIRLGVSDKTVLDSLSWFKTGDKSLRPILDIAFGTKADIGELAQTVLESKDDLEKTLKTLQVSPGTPVASKLVEREANSEAVWKRMPNAFVQPKLDGLRGQLHYKKAEAITSSEDLSEELQSPVSIFSRNMETMTDQFPEIALGLTQLGVDSIILDSEIIGFNDTSQKYMSYQDTMKRRRKYDIGEYSKNIPVKAMCFDILYLNGEDLTQTPIEVRLQKLEKILEKSNSALAMLETKQMTSEDELEEYFKDKVENGLEGIITKQPGTNYDPGTRNFKWIKLKANTRSDLVDTIDAVVLGYYAGKGDRARFGFGTLLAGVYDPKEDKYYSIGKVGSGFKEEEMKKIFEDMSKLKIDSKPENVEVESILFPDVWIEPKIVIEVIADEITRSPSHTAARNKPSKVPNDDSAKGLSIRFPRMKLWMRDKNLPNTVDEIIRMYELRKG
jgi:DNA ligase 1